ncbi:MAG: hypothetical protein ACI8RZ_004042 [Myxococcota bacterium]|jgi:hypothetical protein
MLSTMSLLIALLVGCDEPAPPVAPPTTSIDLSGEPESFQTCVAQVCSDALTDADALAVCRAEPCAAREAAWSLSPDTVRYSDGILSVGVSVDHTPAGHGPVDAAAEPEVWLGVTVLTEDGKDIDLAVQTVFLDRLDEPFVFSSEVGDGVQDIIFGLWGERIEPCDVARSGCQMFGFVLDKSLAAWPPLTYIESPPRRQRILTEPVTLQVLNAGVPMEPARSSEKLARASLEREVGRFGSSVTVLPMVIATTMPPATTVYHRNDHDGPIASIVAPDVAPEDVEVGHDPAATADFTVVLWGNPERLACLQEKCADLSAPCDCSW